jgi:hypothetical protein
VQAPLRWTLAYRNEQQSFVLMVASSSIRCYSYDHSLRSFLYTHYINYIFSVMYTILWTIPTVLSTYNVFRAVPEVPCGTPCRRLVR